MLWASIVLAGTPLECQGCGGAHLWHAEVMQETQHHPASVDLELVKRLLAATKAPTLRAFLTREFCNISDEYAREATLQSAMQAP